MGEIGPRKRTGRDEKRTEILECEGKRRPGRVEEKNTEARSGSEKEGNEKGG
jgi:hypothetical protein